MEATTDISLTLRAHAIASLIHADDYEDDLPWTTHLGEVVGVLTYVGLLDPKIISMAWLKDVLNRTRLNRTTLTTMLAGSFGSLSVAPHYSPEVNAIADAVWSLTHLGGPPWTSWGPESYERARSGGWEVVAVKLAEMFVVARMSRRTGTWTPDKAESIGRSLSSLVLPEDPAEVLRLAQMLRCITAREQQILVSPELNRRLSEWAPLDAMPTDHSVWKRPAILRPDFISLSEAEGCDDLVRVLIRLREATSTEDVLEDNRVIKEVDWLLREIDCFELFVGPKGSEGASRRRVWPTPAGDS